MKKKGIKGEEEGNNTFNGVDVGKRNGGRAGCCYAHGGCEGDRTGEGEEDA